MAKTTTREEIEKFVKESLVPANNTRVECADGRYTPEQSQGAIRAFGGDFGFVLAFAGALKSEGTFIDPDEIVERYYRAVRQFRGEGTKLYYHTDEEHHVKGEKGCGHAAQASNPNNKNEYGVSSDEARELYDKFEKHTSSHITILQGKHEEQGVLLVKGTNHSMNSRSKDKSFFVVTPASIDLHIDLIAPKFSKGLIHPVDPEDVKAFYIRQQTETSRRLKADQLPHFDVNPSNKNGHFTVEQHPVPKPQYAN